MTHAHNHRGALNSELARLTRIIAAYDARTRHYTPEQRMAEPAHILEARNRASELAFALASR